MKRAGWAIACLAALVLLAFVASGDAAATLYAARDVANKFLKEQWFSLGMKVSQIVSDAADAGPHYNAAIDFDNSFSPSASTNLGQVRVTGAIANPTTPLIIGDQAGGSLPNGTYHVTYAWIGRYSNGLNGSTQALAAEAMTLAGGQGDHVVSGTNNTMIFTLPTAYPTGATGVNFFCARDGFLSGALRFCGTMNYPSTSLSIVSYVGTIVPPTTNNTTDIYAFRALANGFVSFPQPVGIGSGLSFRIAGPSTVTAYKAGPSFDYSHDDGATFYRLRDPLFYIPVCAAGGPTIASVFAAMDGTTLPVPTATGTIQLVQVGSCQQETVTWKSYVDMLGMGPNMPRGFTPVTVDFTNVVDVAIRDFSNPLFITGSGAARIRFDRSAVSGSLTNSNGILFRAIRTGFTYLTSSYCGQLNVSGGTYTIAESDFTCPDLGVVDPASANIPLAIGSESGAGVATPQTSAQIVNNFMRPNTRTGPGYDGWLRVFVDATPTPSIVTLTGNDIHLDNGDATACIAAAPGQGSLIAINTGVVDSAGLVKVKGSGNTLWERSCEKAIIWRTAQLDPASELEVVGGTMYAETTGTGTSGVDEDAHCYEGAIGAPAKPTFKGGQCVVVNNNGEARPFYMHEGCCGAGEHPIVYVEDYDIQTLSAAASAGQGFGVGTSCGSGTGCDMFVSRTRIAATHPGATGWVGDVYLDPFSPSTSNIILTDVEYDPTTTTTSFRTRRGLVPQATAPPTCQVGDRYEDTSGGDCVCTASGTPGTWTNTHGVGNCS